MDQGVSRGYINVGVTRFAVLPLQALVGRAHVVDARCSLSTGTKIALTHSLTPPLGVAIEMSLLVMAGVWEMLEQGSQLSYRHGIF